MSHTHHGTPLSSSSLVVAVVEVDDEDVVGVDGDIPGK
jgi:hypothetical protein